MFKKYSTQIGKRSVNNNDVEIVIIATRIKVANLKA